MTVDIRGKRTTKLVLNRHALWYRFNKHDLVCLFVVRGPKAVEPDNFFFTTDTSATSTEVVERYFNH